ncbi:MAG: cobyric acid synthase [Solirubrobacteraceae bacterium]
MRPLMVQGVSSSSGKSLVTAALARALRRRGVDVVPFKAMNISNNARVVTGGEIGTAQYLQALAAGVEPDVRMNPVLIKPEADTRSQVVLLGLPDLELSRRPWRERSGALWPVIEDALRNLLAGHELVLIEGAGSPAEINLRDSDLANMRTARAAGARVLLVADIDRGGAFAHLYGTWALLEQEQRELITGFVLNKFRGDEALLAPGPARLAQLTGVPMLGVLPWLEHGLPDEDGAAPAQPDGTRTVAVVRYPTASNLDEFKPLQQLGLLRWATEPRHLDGAELVVLPGSKHVAADLAWLTDTGVATALAERVARGEPLLGICGGLQMLGEQLCDEADVDGSATGLGLLSLRTTFLADKHTERTLTRFGRLPPPWTALSGRTLRGYQIRHGRTHPSAAIADALPAGLGFVDGPVLGVYVHGLFESPELVRALLGVAPRRELEDAFEQLADAAERHLDIDALLAEPAAAKVRAR